MTSTAARARRLSKEGTGARWLRELIRIEVIVSTVEDPLKSLLVRPHDLGRYRVLPVRSKIDDEQLTRRTQRHTSTLPRVTVEERRLPQCFGMTPEQTSC